MAKNKISEFSSTPANNTDIGGINIAEGCAPSGINNAIRELMAQLKDQQAGTDGDNFTVGGNLSVTGSVTLTNALPIAQGGTGNTTASTAINALMPSQTSNSGKYLTTNGTTVSWGTVTPGTGTVTSVNLSGGTTGLTSTGGPITSSGTLTLGGTLAVANGGTGSTTLTAGSVVVGNGTSAVSLVAPSTSGNVLTSNGSTWSSSALPNASASASGVVSTGSQTFAGTKTFNSALVSSNGYNFTTTSSLFWTGSEAQIRISGNMRFFVNGSSAGFDLSDVQKVGGGSFNTYSDSRYKQDISAYNKGLSELNQINPKNYRYTAEFMKSDSPSQQFVGVIAQELEGTAFANCVKTDSNGFKIVDTSELTFALINAVKEMGQRIEQLEAKNG